MTLNSRLTHGLAALLLLTLAGCHESPRGTATAATDALTAADGYLAAGVTLDPFEDHPALTNLDPDLLAAVRQAASDARAAGVEMFISSGWRSQRYQQFLLDEAVEKYGSEAEARKWVNTPELSTHVSGQAVDFGPTDAMSWLSQRGDDYGLCQIYANEMWHYELVIAPGEACPAQLENAAEGS